ncbi:phosphatidate cytidylyltransferase [Mycoplasma iguanae]|uniref:Phosphatidate cytidylyltransferase n=1 Tax=Mycoplasma iguanae TaxID=292461 RepID=A0ABY5R8T1_9MOLU|nr:phosphatidate cytidylyltransferase [Mycoplasma iguanae]UVD81691.1 phosphatidate cytidylyltransferase [Mycoplasma iguanae]
MKIKITKKIQKNKLLLRTITTLIILLFFITSFFITGYLKMGGRIYGVIFYAILCSIGIYEFVSHSEVKKIFVFYYIILGLILLFLPWHEYFYVMINQGSTKYMFIEQLKHWWIYLIIIIGSAFPFLFLIQKKDLKFITKNYLLNLFAVLTFPIFIKWLLIINTIPNEGVYILLYIGLITATTDTLGLFGGMLFGRKIFKRGFAPKLSPRKSWEGAIIAWFFAVFVVVFIGSFYINKLLFLEENQFLFFSISTIVLLPLASIWGDLLFSKIKRTFHVKDFSQLIPGHGGLLDRFDSTFLVTYTFVFLIIFFN